MKSTGSDNDFDRWLERELRRTVASAQGPSPRASHAAYNDASRRGGKALTAKSWILSKGAAGLVAAALALGGGSAVAMAATGSHSPGELAKSVAKIVEECKDARAANAQGSSHGIGECVSDQVNKNRNGEAHQQMNGVSDADEHKSSSSSSSSAKHTDHGQGNGAGSTNAPGQGGHGNEGSHPTPSSGNHGHEPSPHP